MNLATTSITTKVAAVVPMVLPPGMDKLSVLSAWFTGLVGLFLFWCFIASIGKTGVAALRRGEFEGGQASVIILICAIVLGSASAIFTTFAVVS